MPLIPNSTYDIYKADLIILLNIEIYSNKELLLTSYRDAIYNISRHITISDSENSKLYNKIIKNYILLLYISNKSL